MTDKKVKYIWSKQKLSKDCETIDCPEYDDYRDFKRDSSGNYVLIKVNLEEPGIEVAICDKDHNLTHIFKGKKSQDLYDGIFSYEKKNNITWFNEKTHIAYLGKELKKAELALNAGSSDYYQE